jgi:hypothetical protein
MKFKMSHKIGLLAAVVLMIIVAGIYFWPKKPAPQPPAPQTTQSFPAQALTSPKPSFFSATGTWREYLNKDLGLSFQLPEKWNVDDKQNKNLVLVDNVQLIPSNYAGGIPDGWVKIDIENIPDVPLGDWIDCAKKVEGTLSCEETDINGKTFRMRAVSSATEGPHKELMIGIKTKNGILAAIGYAPQGSNQENAMQTIEKIFRTLKLN